MTDPKELAMRLAQKLANLGGLDRWAAEIESALRAYEEELGEELDYVYSQLGARRGEVSIRKVIANNDRRVAEHSFVECQAACYTQARGGDDRRFERHGANQMYWKGRSEAAEDIRNLKLGDSSPLAEHDDELRMAIRQELLDSSLEDSAKILGQAVEAERLRVMEECCKICEETRVGIDLGSGREWRQIRSKIAAAIRARFKEVKK